MPGGRAGRGPRTAAAALLVAVVAGGCNHDDAGPATRAYVYDGDAQVRMALPDSMVTEEGTTLNRRLLLRGDSIYHGLVARGSCSMCHGNHGRGGPIGRDFTDNDWSHIDGSYERIQGLVIGGIDYDPPMPPFGGAALAEDDVRAVAAYVYWLSRRDGNPLRPGGEAPAAAGADEQPPMQNGA